MTTPALRFACLALAGGALAAAAGVAAQAYPTRPIRIVVPFSPGGSADVTARLLADRFTGALGTNVVVDNRAGASGIIGTEIVAKAAPDGHTLGMVALSFAINPSLHRLPYDTERDLLPVTIVTSVPLVLVVSNSLPVKSVRELIDLAKAKPGALAFASSGTGSSPHLTAELFMAMTGVRMAHVPYKGSTQAHPDVIGGQVNVMFDTVVATATLIRAGRLKALGVTSGRRSPEFPDLPTVTESGVPGFESTSWVVMLAPARTPSAVVERLNQETVRALGLPEVRERLARLGAEPVGNSSAEARRFVHAEVEKWAKTVKNAGIKEAP